MSNKEKEYQIEEVEKNFNNREFMVEALKNNAPWVLAYASDRLHADRKLMLEAVKQDGQLLYYASKELRDDKEVVEEAIKNKWLILKYASKRLRSDKEIANLAIEQNEKTKEFLIKSYNSRSI